MTQTEKALRLKTDEAWMDFALDEAKKAWRLSPPNPSVGAVIVKDGRLIGAGSTQQTGGPHAEIMALRDAEARGENVEGATVYVAHAPLRACADPGEGGARGGGDRRPEPEGLRAGSEDARGGRRRG